MTPRTADTNTGRPNRILIALAAAWIVVSLAIGGAANPGTDQAQPTPSLGRPARDAVAALEGPDARLRGP